MNAISPALDVPIPPPADGGLPGRIALVRRRARPALIAFGTVLGAALLLALLWPPEYRSTGTVLIEQQEIPDQFVRAAISSFADQRVRTISQRVMTTPNLLEIIRKYDLYPERQRREPREKLVQRMRDDIGLEMISADVMDPRQGRPTKATIAFEVSYNSGSPLLAAKVANELTTLYLNENLASRRKQAESTADFLAEEVRRVGDEVQDLEQRIADFKDGNADALPERAQVNIQLMTRADEELRAAQLRSAALEQQIIYLDAQLAQIDPLGSAFLADGQRVLSTSQRLKLLRTQLASASALYGPEHPDVVRLQREVAGLEREAGAERSDNDVARQLGEARKQLAQLRDRYSAEHPDVQRLERVVAGIEQQLRGTSGVSTALQAAENPDNPAYIQVKAQREAAVNERAALNAQMALLSRRVAEFGQRLTDSPDVEREYSALLRELEGAQFKYQEVRQKFMEARVASNLETEQKGERFTLIDPPLVPERPVSPNLRLILALGLLLAAGAAAATVLLLDQLDRSVRDRADLAALLAVPPLAAIPWIQTDEDGADRRRRRRYMVLGAFLALLATAVSVHFMLRPLDVLWHVLLRRIGL